MISMIDQRLLILVVLSGIARGYTAVRKGYQTYQRHNRNYNPITKFETRLPPGYRKPYRYLTKAGEGLLTGQIIYDVYNDITNQDAVPTLLQPKTYKFNKKRSRQFSNPRSRYKYGRRCCKCNRQSSPRKRY